MGYDEELEDEEDEPDPTDGITAAPEDESEDDSEDLQHPEVIALQKIPLYTIAKKPGYGLCLPFILEQDFRVSHFAEHIQDFIHLNLPQQSLPSLNFIQTTCFPVFKKFSLFLSPAPEVTMAVVPDPVRATRATPAKGLKKAVSAKCDTVLVRVKPEGGRLLSPLLNSEYIYLSTLSELQHNSIRSSGCTSPSNFQTSFSTGHL